jgi:hypothetical protein
LRCIEARRAISVCNPVSIPISCCRCRLLRSARRWSLASDPWQIQCEPVARAAEMTRGLSVILGEWAMERLKTTHSTPGCDPSMDCEGLEYRNCRVGPRFHCRRRD